MHSSGRYIVDQFNQPWLLVGDSGWCAFTNISAADHAYYFASRAAAGFNTIMCAAIADTYVSNINGDAMTTFDGVAPFTAGTGSSMDISTPNSVYWNRLDTFVALAASYGLAIMFVPNESGSPATGAAGIMVINNGATKARAFGQFLGNRYKNSHVMWLHGNDYGGDGGVSNPATVWAAGDPALTAVNQGIRDVAANQLQSIELDFLISTSNDDSTWTPLIDLNAIYVYDATDTEALVGYNASPTKPTFHVEGSYENSSLSDGSSGTFSAATATDQRLMLRRQTWLMQMAGGTGGLYGNQNVFPFTGSWKTALDTTSTAELKFTATLLRGLAWYSLVPDQSGTFLTGGTGTHNTDPLTNSLCRASKSADGHTALLYSPGIHATRTGVNTTPPDTSPSPVVDLSLMAGTTLCRWWDPTTGNFTAIGSFSASHTFTPPAAHADGTRDWVLVMTA